MRSSVIVSTYNQPDWLELVLWGLSVQTWSGFELLIADDGSDERTTRVLERLQAQSTLRPAHIRHEDRGFRKCAILNQAIAQASGEYIIFLDGDCVPRADFVQQHAILAASGSFLSGGAARLPMALCRGVSQDDVISGRVHNWRWLRSQGVPLSRDMLKLFGIRVSAGRILDAITSTRPTFNGGNTSAWKSDLLRVNGFDERMGHGGLDRELGERLENTGIRGKQVRHRCICVHLDHPRSYAHASVKGFNDRLRRQTRENRAVWTPHGILKTAARAG